MISKKGAVGKKIADSAKLPKTEHISKITKDKLKESLALACREGDLVTVKKILEQGIGIDEKINVEGASALMVAADYKHTDIVRFLLDEGADIHAQDNEGNPFLFYCVFSSEEILRMAVDSGLDINKQYMGGENAVLHLVYGTDAYEVDPAMLRALLSMGADINMTNSEGSCALFEIMESDHFSIPEEKQKYYEILGIFLEEANLEQETKLLFSSRIGDLDQVMANYNDQIIEAKDALGRTSLFLACEDGHLEVAEFLIRNGANPNTQDMYDIPILNWAITAEQYEIVRLLLENGADRDSVGPDGSATESAYLCKDKRIAELFQ
jgi:ankyrin repeat protein